ncbi:MAG TPA: PilT/PilU family type 4a pilus ATPase, partial [Pyrinomonadaceae bacterium]|nr:PilT/PilU family type 4a pilus ATPase [Pyrinomonadaceae bacterium]
MEKLNQYLSVLMSSSSEELRLEPNKNPVVFSANGTAEVAAESLSGSEITSLVFPLIPPDVRTKLPSSNEVEFTHPHNLGNFQFHIRKSPAGFLVSVKPIFSRQSRGHTNTPPIEPLRFEERPAEPGLTELPAVEAFGSDDASEPLPPIYEEPSGFVPPPREYVPEPEVVEPAVAVEAAPIVDRRQGDRRKVNHVMVDRMEALFRQMAEVGASDLHLSADVVPMVRKDGKIQQLECAEGVLTPDLIAELLTSIMPEKNREEFARRSDTDFAYEILGLARFRCNVFRDRKGMGGVFRIIPSKILTAEDLGLSKAIMDLCNLSKGLVVVTGPTGSGKSTTLCAMIDAINKNRDDHILTIEDPIEFVHENQKCLINQREVHNHTNSFKDALRAALREDPDIVLVGEMRDLETISIAIETAETGHLVFGTLHTTTAASTVDRIIDQFPADRQQQIRVMLSES